MESLLEQRQQNELEVKEDVAVTSEMAFVVDHGALMNALTICGKVIPKSSAIPIMQTIKFDLNGDTLFITAVDVSQSVLQMISDEKTPALNGIHLYNHDGKLGFQATDRHRISRLLSDLTLDNLETFESSIIPAQNFNQIVDLLKDSMGIQLALTSTYLILRDKNIVYFGRLIDATFPDLYVAFKEIDQGNYDYFN